MRPVKITDIFFKENVLCAQAKEDSNLIYPVKFILDEVNLGRRSYLDDNEDYMLIPAKTLNDFGNGWKKIEYLLDLNNDNAYTETTDYLYYDEAINIMNYKDEDIFSVLNKTINIQNKDKLIEILDFLEAADNDSRFFDRLFLYSKETFDNLRKTLPSREDLRKQKYDYLLKLHKQDVILQPKMPVVFNSFNKDVYSDFLTDVYEVLKEKINNKETWHILRKELAATEDLSNMTSEFLKDLFNDTFDSVYQSVTDDFGHTPLDGYKSDILDELRRRNVPIQLQ